MSNTIHANSLCKSNGHDWRRTTAQNYRICQREKCCAAEHLVNGAWTPVQAQRARRPRQPHPLENLLLWDEKSLLAQGLHPRQREIERATERRHFQFCH